MAAKPRAPEERPSAPAWASELADSDRRFVEEYLIDLNATQAYLRAGLGTPENVANARSRAHELIHKPHIAKAIDLAMAESGAGPRQWIVRRLGEIARADVSEFMDVDDDGHMTLKAFSKIPEGMTALIKKIVRTKDGEIRFELHDPLRALEILAKVGSIGLTKDQVELQASETLADLIVKAAGARKGKT